MFYYLYEIKNNLNGKIYVGVHKTKSMDDGYMGSGKVIKRAIKKHGIENFTKVILEYFDTSDAMYAKEKEVVTPEFLQRDDVYNLRRGGFGGFEYINAQVNDGNIVRDSTKGGLARSKLYRDDAALRAHIKKVKSDDWYRQQALGKLVPPPKIQVSCIVCKRVITTSNLNKHFISHTDFS